MRKEFAENILSLAGKNEKIIFLTADLGFMAFEEIRAHLGPRFINTGVSEQNMISVAAGLASQGLIPVCYSIAPFIAGRPAEQIRIDVCLHNLNVKMVGNGGGYGYGIMGPTHHAIEDIAILSSFQNIKCLIPFCNEDIPGCLNLVFEYEGPVYLRLGLGNKPASIPLETPTPFRKLCSGNKLTIAGMGPVIINVLKALEMTGRTDIADVFVISEIPLTTLPENFQESLRKNNQLLIIEEHVKRGGLGEHLSLLLAENGVFIPTTHFCAKGYPNGLFGNQQYHQQLSGLDVNSISTFLKTCVHV